tara:strand:+ start:206 stop:2008 length:1803 start_codon:yes stop_codon:yes gene_type:complete
MSEVIMGNEAIAKGLIHAGIDMVCAYPGTPSSEILSAYQHYSEQYNLDTYAKWCVNEKVAFEVAYAGAVARKKTCAVMKQVGLNVAADAMFSSAYTGVVGSFVIVSADDPGCYSSQTEQDSRMYAKFAKIPVLEPSTGDEAFRFPALVAELSEWFETPVMLRTVLRLSHVRSQVDSQVDTSQIGVSYGGFERDVMRWAAPPRNPRLKQAHGLAQKVRELAKYNFEHFIQPYRFHIGKHPYLVIASGTGYLFAKEIIDQHKLDVDLLKIDMPYPLPRPEMETICQMYQQVVVIEEGEPCMEEQLRGGNVYGQLNQPTLNVDEMTHERVMQTFIDAGIYAGANPYLVEKAWQDVPKVPAQMCAGCPHRDVYYAIIKEFERDAIMPSDIGCYTLGLNQQALDSYLCMGASVTMASGFSHAQPDKPIVATMGDSTFFHAGIPGLVNAVNNQDRMILFILDNRTIAMTGAQRTPEANEQISIEGIVRGLGIEPLIFDYEPNLMAAQNFVRAARLQYEKSTGPVVGIVNEYCLLDKHAKPNLPTIRVEVDQVACIGCGHCITKFACPAIKRNDKVGKAYIDQDICIGCGICMTGLCDDKAFVEIKG